MLGQSVDPAKAARARELRSNQSAAEQLLWSRLRARRLQGLHVRRQQVIAGFIVDFYCHVAGLAIEIDGTIHTTQAALDRSRDSVRADHAVRVLRFTNADVFHSMEPVLQEILAACSSNP